MGSSARRQSALTRRAILGGIGGLTACRSLPSVAASRPSPTVMTRNLYLGASLARLFRAKSMADVRDAAGQLLEHVESHPYEARMEAIAAEVETTRPDVVGVQEAALVRTQEPGDFPVVPFTNASSVLVDLLELLSAKLDDRGLAYDVAATTVSTDVEVPADADGGQVDVRLTDRTAVLVQEGVETGPARTGAFDAALSVPVAGFAVRIQRGYCLVDVTVEGVDLTVATAHLEPADADVRLQQTEELLDVLPTDRPVVLAGDVNSGPGGQTAAYGRLAESFEDAYSLRSGGGFTCCQSPDLQNEQSKLSHRVDHVLARGGLGPTDVERVGADPEDRVTVDLDGERARMWPSDHAGVVASFETIDSMAAAAETPGESAGEATPDQNPLVDVPIPGFGPVEAVVALVVATLARRWRSD